LAAVSTTNLKDIKMSEINFGKTVSLAQAAKLILATPMNRYMLRGEPGIGKSSLLKTLSASLPNHETAYIDVPNMDLGDIAMPVINHENKTTAYYPNARFKVHTGKPIITMLDEFTKGAEPIKNMLHPLLEVANPRLGDISVHPESIVFLTGNLASDGVGDTLKAHTLNRIIPLNVRKPDADEWITWAINNGIEAEVIAWVRQFPQAMASYTDPAQSDNPYIYNPKKVQTSYVSPRSLERVSNIVRVRSQLDMDSLICAMSGAVGEAASRDMQAYIEFADQLPTWESVMENPKTAKVPDGAGACAIIVFGAIAKVTKDTMAPFMNYLERFEPEWQACFAINIAKSPAKQSIAFSSAKFADWVQKNEDLL
jgi:energy-coupling factor transporter ATP-binding protein EcfA2